MSLFYEVSIKRCIFAFTLGFKRLKRPLILEHAVSSRSCDGKGRSPMEVKPALVPLLLKLYFCEVVIEK